MKIWLNMKSLTVLSLSGTLLNLLFLGDLDFNNFENMFNQPLSFILAIVITIFILFVGTNTFIAIIGNSYNEVIAN